MEPDGRGAWVYDVPVLVPGLVRGHNAQGESMIGFEVHVNGQPVCLASVGDAGVLSAIVNWVVSEQPSPEEREPLTLHVGGLAGVHHYTWIPMQVLNVGDVVEIKIVEVESANESLKAAQVKSVPEGKAGWFDEAREKYRKGRT